MGFLKSKAVESGACEGGMAWAEEMAFSRWSSLTRSSLLRMTGWCWNGGVIIHGVGIVVWLKRCGGVRTTGRAGDKEGGQVGTCYF